MSLCGSVHLGLCLFVCLSVCLSVCLLSVCMQDRDIDLSVMIQHTWTYQALIHDVFEFKSDQRLNTHRHTRVGVCERVYVCVWSG